MPLDKPHLHCYDADVVRVEPSSGIAISAELGARLKLVCLGEVLARIEHDTGQIFAPTTLPKPRAYPAGTKAFTNLLRLDVAANFLALLTARPRLNPLLAQTLGLSPLRASTG